MVWGVCEKGDSGFWLCWLKQIKKMSFRKIWILQRCVSSGRETCQTCPMAGYGCEKSDSGVINKFPAPCPTSGVRIIDGAVYEDNSSSKNVEGENGVGGWEGGGESGRGSI